MIKKRRRTRYCSTLFLLGILGGCQQYEIKYMGQARIVEQEVKLPDIEPTDYDGGFVGNNVAFHFTLENIEIDDLIYNEFLWLNLFICGQEKFETDLHSALYFSDELKFAVGQDDNTTDKSLYAVFIPDLLADIKKSAEKQDESICAKIVYRYPYELKKVSNTVKLDGLPIVTDENPNP